MELHFSNTPSQTFLNTESCHLALLLFIFVEDKENSEWKDYKISFRLEGLGKEYFVKKSGKFFSVVESIDVRPGRVGSKTLSFNGIDCFSSIKSLKENMEADEYIIG